MSEWLHSNKEETVTEEKNEMKQNISNEFMNLVTKGKFRAENMQACGTIARLSNTAMSLLFNQIGRLMPVRIFQLVK